MSSHESHVDASDFNLSSRPRGGGHLVVGRRQNNDVFGPAESLKRCFTAIHDGDDRVTVFCRIGMPDDGEISVADSIENHRMAFDPQ